jgi:phosphoheptose isomerase
LSALHDLRPAAPEAVSVPGKFPAARYESAGAYFRDYAKEMARASESLDTEAIGRAGRILAEAYAGGARMFSCGNGGSAAIANHMQCDHLKGIRTGTDLAPQVLSLSTNVEVLTAIANDIGYEAVFAYQLQSQAEPGDLLIAVSSSGRSRNISSPTTRAIHRVPTGSGRASSPRWPAGWIPARSSAWW